MFPTETMIRRDMDFLRVAVELASPVHGGSVEAEAGECNGARGFSAGAASTWVIGGWDALSITFGLVSAPIPGRDLHLRT